MARKSAASLTVVHVNAAYKPPRIPEGLPPKGKAFFAEILASVPPNHFRVSDGAAIEQYVQDYLNAQEAQKQIDKGMFSRSGEVNPAVAIRDKFAKLCINHRRSLRLSPSDTHRSQSQSSERATADHGPLGTRRRR